MQKSFIISIDQGTTGSRVFCFDAAGKILSSAYKEFSQHFPEPGWVEHDAMEIYNGVVVLLNEAVKKADLNLKNASGIAVTNQRETVVMWDRKTGLPIHNAIVWQCRRTADICETLKNNGHSKIIHEKTGLVIDAYFSGTKIQWLLNHVSGIKARAEKGEICAGTIDSWLLFKLTGEHKTDYTNASRTMIFNIIEKKWDDDLLKMLQIPRNILPEVCPSRNNFGKTKDVPGLPDGIPVLAMAGDQQAALFGQLCTKPNQAKNTYGTGCFLLYNTGKELIYSKSGLLTTLACDSEGMPVYALEGSVFIGGAVIQWLRDYMKFFANASETDEIIKEIHSDSENLVFVPAFVGLGAPHWDMNARGAIFGLTRNTTPAQMTKAALKSIALQTMDITRAMEQDTNQNLSFLRVDGGAANNSFLMQYQANILNKRVERPKNLDTTALGTAYLAGLESGLWDMEKLKTFEQNFTSFVPEADELFRNHEIKYWNKAVNRVKNWTE